MSRISRAYQAVLGATTKVVAVASCATRDSYQEEMIKNAIDSVVILATKPIKKYVFSIDQTLDTKTVETKYDQLSGRYIEEATSGARRVDFYVVNGVVGKYPYANFQTAKFDEYASILSELEFSTLLEVGAGELNTIAAMASRFKNTVEYYALDLSFNRVFQGREHFCGLHGLPIEVSKADAVRLPYPDNAFDVVYTSHCLEHMPLHYRAAIDEMWRVARKAVVLFEPSYELGAVSQRLRILSRGYVRGIPSYLDSLEGMVAQNRGLLQNGSLFNRTACYIVTPKTQAESVGVDIRFVCPACRTTLVDRDSWFLCDSCMLGYGVVAGIPILDLTYSVPVQGPGRPFERR